MLRALVGGLPSRGAVVGLLRGPTGAVLPAETESRPPLPTRPRGEKTPGLGGRPSASLGRAIVGVFTMKDASVVDDTRGEAVDNETIEPSMARAAQPALKLFLGSGVRPGDTKEASPVGVKLLLFFGGCPQG